MIFLSAGQQKQINDHAAAAYPNECCGLLVGHDTDDGTVAVTRVIPSPNILTERARDRFEVDPQIRIDLEIELRGAHDRLVGHFHSHPDHPAVPSATDLERAYEPDLIWLITNVADGQAGDTKAYRLDQTASQFTELEISLTK